MVMGERVPVVCRLPTRHPPGVGGTPLPEGAAHFPVALFHITPRVHGALFLLRFF